MGSAERHTPCHSISCAFRTCSQQVNNIICRNDTLITHIIPSSHAMMRKQLFLHPHTWNDNSADEKERVGHEY